MFKKTKTNKTLLPLPPPIPCVENILEDMKTFQIDTPVVAVAKSNCGNIQLTDSTITLDTWWNIFEQFINDLKCLQLVNNEIDELKAKLLADKVELEAEEVLLKKEITKQQKMIDEALK